MDFYEIYGWEIHKNATCFFVQILEAAPNKVTGVQPLISYLRNDPNKTSKTCWRSKNELISDVLLRTFIHEYISQSTKSYIHQLCKDTKCLPEDLPRTMTNRNGSQEKGKEICDVGTAW